MKTAEEILSETLGCELERINDTEPTWMHQGDAIKAMEAYASQFRPSSEAIKAAMRHGHNFAMNGSEISGETWAEFKDRIAGELSGSGWISVEERLPEVGEFVLVYNTEGATLTGRLYENGWAALFIDGEKLAGELAVTHWQHLPSPPTK